MNDYFTASRSSTPTGAAFGRLRVSGDHLLMVLYDSITNSVFESQVFTPLMRMIERGEVQRVTLVTFESDLQIKNQLEQFNHPTITFIVLKRYPLLGIWTLRLAARQLKSALAMRATVIRARGPLAGLIAKYFLELDGQQPEGLARAVLTIQARGLCAEEYRFTSEQKKLSWWQKIVVAWRTKLYDRIEQKAYMDPGSLPGMTSLEAPVSGLTIEVVSEALGEYLQKTYATPAAMIRLAQHDLVDALPADYVAAQRKEMRALLSIPTDAYVFCYSGSCKPWQCAEETVQFFAQEIQANSEAFLLILSQDVVAFQSLLVQYAVPAERVRLLAVKPADLLRYLCAADAGMLLRQPDVVNWVSRPTKLLEYQAVGLRVVHNGAIGMLAKKR
ncbi:glycosyltransferase family 4 protein [Candidatus Dependentiae bacterium]|nr:glycosyltransferase family 4 protein [Candidatus Dependentiae bacterium]